MSLSHSIRAFPTLITAGALLTAPVGASAEGNVAQGLQLGGHLHTLVSHQSTDNGGGGTEDASDVHVSSLELGLTASPFRYADATVVWLREEDVGRTNPDFHVDQAFVTLAGTSRVLAGGTREGTVEDSAAYLQVGKMYIPFATNLAYHTFDVISEPQTLQLGETLESGVRVGYHPAELDVYAGVYGGAGQEGSLSDGEPADTDDLDDVFAGINYEGDAGGLAVQYMSNLNNSLALQEELGTRNDQEQLTAAEDAVGGLTLFGHGEVGPLQGQLSYVTALADYELGNFAGRRPSALNGELTWTGAGMLPDERPLRATLVYSHTEEWFDHPENSVGAVVGTDLAEGVAVAGEVLHRDYDSSLSSGADTETIASGRLAVGFSELLGRMRSE